MQTSAHATKCFKTSCPCYVPALAIIRVRLSINKQKLRLAEFSTFATFDGRRYLSTLHVDVVVVGRDLLGFLEILLEGRLLLVNFVTTEILHPLVVAHQYLLNQLFPRFMECLEFLYVVAITHVVRQHVVHGASFSVRLTVRERYFIRIASD